MHCFCWSRTLNIIKHLEKLAFSQLDGSVSCWSDNGLHSMFTEDNFVSTEIEEHKLSYLTHTPKTPRIIPYKLKQFDLISNEHKDLSLEMN